MKKHLLFILFFGVGYLTLSPLVIAQKFNRPNIPGPNGIQVNSFNGNIYYERQDHYLPGRGFPLNLAFSYNGLRDTLDFGYGKGWTLAYNLYYERDSVDNIIMVRGDGRRDVFQAEEIGYLPPAGVFDFLEEYETGKLRLTTKTGMRYFFEDASHKRLTKMTDTNGNELLLTYEAGRPITLSNTAGRSLAMTWENDRLKEVTDASISPARKIQYAYDINGYLSQVTDPLGKTQRYQYNEQGQITEMTDKNGQTTSLIYNSNNVISQVCSPISTLTLKYHPEKNQTFAIEDASSGNQVTTYTFNEVGNLIRKKGNCCGFDVQYEYDEDNNIRQMTDANGSVTNYTYDGRGNLISETDALGNQTIYSYESTLNRLIGVLDANGNTVNNTYDDKGNLTTVALPEGITLAYTYDQFGNMTAAIDGKGNTTSFEYDGVGNVTKTTYPSGEETYSYDNAGNMLSLTDINGNTLVFTYDALDRLTKLADPLGNEVMYEYDGNGNLTQEIDPNGNLKSYGYDALNRIQQVTTPAGTTNYTYDQLGNLTSIKDANGKVNTYTYNSLNLVASETDGAGFTTSYEYDGDGNLLAKVTPNGDIIEYAYDVLDRLVSKKYGDNEDVFAYDALGNLVNASNNAISYRYEYDGLNRLVSKSATNWQKVIRYTYDANGNRSTMTDPNGGITQYTYDADNRLTQLQNPFGELFEFTHDGAGRITRQDNSNGTYTTYTYNNADRLTAMVNHDAGGGIISRHTYTYDANGNRLSMDTEEGTHTYTYDGDNRLLTVNYADGSTESFTYDATGNQMSKTTDGITTNYTYDEADRLLTANDISFGFDANGNLIEKNDNGQITRYNYDPENRLMGVTLPDGRQISYAYDPFGDRVGKTTLDGIETRYLLDGDNVLQELDGNNNRVAQYTATEVMDSWLGMHRNGQNYTYHKDALNSTMALSNSTGNIVNEYTYEAYGKIKSQTESISNPYTYAGREIDPVVGLYYYRTRYYKAEIGRFIVKDFFKGFMQRPMSINKYAYVENNPIIFTDPEGKAIPFLLGWAMAGLAMELANQLVQNNGKWECTDFVGLGFGALTGGIGSGVAKIARTGSLTSKYSPWGGHVSAKLVTTKIIHRHKAWKEFQDVTLREGDAILLSKWQRKKRADYIINEIHEINQFLQKEIAALIFDIWNLVGTFELSLQTINIFSDNNNNQSKTEECNPILGWNDIQNISNAFTEIDWETIFAIDPNDILGPAGYGPEKWVSVNENLDYTIRFENDPDFATAAARNVFIDMPLQANTDRGSFRVGNYGFGNFLYETPENRSYHEALLDVSDSLGVVVNYISGLDVPENKGFWIFNAVNPITRLEPTDARLGFLPVNDTTIGNGEGFVNFTMRADPEAITGDTLYAQASIVFDEENPIITNRHFNKIDASYPQSQIDSVLSVTDTTFEIFASASDVGSGLASYDVFLSENGGDFIPYLEEVTSDTSFTFIGSAGVDYCLFTVARDNVGNSQLNSEEGVTAVCFDSKGPILFSTLKGKVNLQGRAEDSGEAWSIPLVLEFYEPGETEPSFSVEVPSDQTGFFAVEDVRRDDYVVTIKNSTTLKNALAVKLGQGNNTVDFGSLREGDANNDNFVGLTDFSLLASSFNLTEGATSFEPRADFNRDAFVGLSDFSLLAANFNQQGDVVTAESFANLPLNTARVVSMLEGKQLPQQVKLSVEVEEEIIGVGETIEAVIWATITDGVIDGAEAHLGFDANALRIKQVIPGRKLDLVLQNEYDNKKGHLDLAVGSLNARPEGRIELARVTFETIDAATESQLELLGTAPKTSQATYLGVAMADIIENDAISIRGKGFEMYPNPTAGMVKVDLYNPAQEANRLEIYNLDGRMLWNTDFGREKVVRENLDLSELLGRGTFLIRMIIGDEQFSQKIVVE